jgi:hypothetical protein
MNTAAATREALWAGVHTAVDSNPPSDLGQQLKDVSGLDLHAVSLSYNIKDCRRCSIKEYLLGWIRGIAQSSMCA